MWQKRRHIRNFCQNEQAMSKTYISAELRRSVVLRAEGLCEYCLLHESDAFFPHQIDHIISEKHGGATETDNLALSCGNCNRLKGSDIASFVPGTSNLVRFFHPRTDTWSEHFALTGNGVFLEALSDVGAATAHIFGFNEEERLAERIFSREAGRFPSAAAWRRIRG